MADHLLAKFRGLCGALTVALLTLALIVPASAEASGPGLDALSQLSNVVPAPAQAAVAAALAQVPSPSPVASVPSATVAIPTPAPSTQTVGPTVATPAGIVPAVAIPVPPPPRPDTANSAPTISVPTVSVRTTGKRPNPPARARPDASLGGQASAHRVSRPKGRRAGQRGLRSPARPAPTRPGPLAAVGARWAPVPPAHAVLVHAHHATAARGAAPRAQAFGWSASPRRASIPRREHGEHSAARPSGVGQPASGWCGGRRSGRGWWRGRLSRSGSARTRRRMHASSLVAGALRPGARPSAIGSPRLEVGTARLAPLD